MSWTQGISERQEWSKGFIEWAENKYFRSFGEIAEFQYAVWHDLGNPVTLDFGTNKVLDIDMSIKRLSELSYKL